MVVMFQNQLLNARSVTDWKEEEPYKEEHLSAMQF